MLEWSRDFVVIDGDRPFDEVVAAVLDAHAFWIVLIRFRGMYQYVFSRDELLYAGIPARSRDVHERLGRDASSCSFVEVLDLHELDQSTQVDAQRPPVGIDTTWRPDTHTPSVFRYVRLDERARQEAVAVASDAGAPMPMAREAAAAPDGHAGGSERQSGTVKGDAGSLPDDFDLDSIPAFPVSGRGTVALPRPPFFPDTTPPEPAPESTPSTPGDEQVVVTRHPSIEVEGAVAAGQPVVVVVDLATAPVAHTEAAPVTVAAPTPDWETIELVAMVSCTQVVFDDADARGTVVIRRNAPSIPARLPGRVRDDVAAATLDVTVRFYHQRRFSGMAFRALPVASAGAGAVAPAPAEGGVVVESDARTPDLTVHVVADRALPGRLDWSLQLRLFDGLPTKLRGSIDLGYDVAAQTRARLGNLSKLTPGEHERQIRGYGNELWKLAPSMFHDVYWAMCDRYRRPLAIQFITSEPHIPWELMRPSRDGEVHEPLAIGHAVARWIEHLHGWMPNRLPAGRIGTIAPKYETASRRLPRAQAESEAIAARYGAERIKGTREDVLALLEADPPPYPVAILHFAGHGVFNVDDASGSSIKLEQNRTLAAGEIDETGVKLGKACRTLVFFNACEVGSTGNVLGEVGGWADAFLGCRFGGFIAPLWSVEDEDAGVVAQELLDGVYRDRRPVAEVLREIRETHGRISPTFYSYLYYGDVGASLAG